jgi:hypothetical protein
MPNRIKRVCKQIGEHSFGKTERVRSSTEAGFGGELRSMTRRLDLHVFIDWQMKCRRRGVVGVPMTSSYGCVAAPHANNALMAMYHSPELYNEGLLSFHYPLYEASDEELNYFLGSLVSSVGKAVGGAAKAVGSVAKTAGKALSTVQKVIPAPVLTAGLGFTPIGLAVRAGIGAVTAAADGKNVFQSAMRSLAGDPVTRFYIDTAMAGARGENLLKAAQKAAQAGIGDLRQSLQFAAMVAPFVPGLGTGVAAALGAANALAAGQPITEALIAAARSAVPGGAVAQMAFDTAMNIAKGKNLSDALLNSARTQLPGGPAAQAAFDAAVALAKGKNIQDAAFAAAGRLLPPSPYAADVLTFVKQATSGQNIQKAALSALGNVVMSRIEQQTGPMLAQVQARVPRVPGNIHLPAIRIPKRLPSNAANMRRSFPAHPGLPMHSPGGRESEYEAGSATNEPGFVQALIAANQRDPYKLTDAVFYARHPEMRGQKITNQSALKSEWLAILKNIVQPLLTPASAAVPPPSAKETVAGHSSDPDVRAAQMIAAQMVPGMPGTTTKQLIEHWRQKIAPEIPASVLLAFIRFESGGNFNDATHGSPRNQPPFTQPEFYELGIFQTPAGLHGRCSTSSYTSCSNPPPGVEKPHDPSPWILLCRKIAANPDQWQNPVTQVRVGLMNLEEPATRVRKNFPDLFPSAGSDWDLRMAVLLPFARGAGFTTAFLSKYRAELAKIQENQRWDFLRGKTVPVRGGLWKFDPDNVDKKINLAVKLGYRPL